MQCLKYVQLDCQLFAEVARKQGVETRNEQDLCNKVPHVGFGGASRSEYTSPKTGKTIYVLERNGWYAGDAYQNDVWQFDTDFTTEQAAEFIAAHDRAANESRARA